MRTGSAQTSRFVAAATAYARGVVSGKILACKWTRLACQRHLDDLKRKGFPYKFDSARATKFCKMIEALPHTKGGWADRRENLHLEGWQCFAVCSLFGWVHRKTGRYRFRKAYIKVPRKNAKSTLAAAIGHCKFAADGEFGAEVYSGATTEKQAWEVFRPARLMAERTPAMQRAFGIQVNAKSLTIEKNGSRFEPIIGKPGDGASPSCAIVDEYHEHPDESLYDTMLTGMGARENPLLLVITTAGDDLTGPCFALECEAERVLQRTMEDEQWFILIYGIDAGDDWKSVDVLKKANPNYGVSVLEDYLLAQRKDALNSARKQNIYKTKHLNVWVTSMVSWMNMAQWEACRDESLNIEDFEHNDCWLGADLASKLDLASAIKVFCRLIDAKAHYYFFGRHYLNEAAVENAATSNYKMWAAEGRLTVTPGNVTDYNWIADDLEKDCTQFNVLEIPHDPNNAQPLLQLVQARPTWPQKVKPVEIKQSRENYTPPMRELEAAVAEKRVHYDDPILSWAVSNVIVKPDPLDLLFPRKLRPENKIDPAVAALMALSRAIVPETVESSRVFFA